MGYQSTMFLLLKLLSTFWTAVPPRVNQKHIFFKFFERKVVRTIELRVVIKDIIMPKFKYVLLNNETIFSHIGFLRSKYRVSQKSCPDKPFYFLHYFTWHYQLIFLKDRQMHQVFFHKKSSQKHQSKVSLWTEMQKNLLFLYFWKKRWITFF